MGRLVSATLPPDTAGKVNGRSGREAEFQSTREWLGRFTIRNRSLDR